MNLKLSNRQQEQDNTNHHESNDSTEVYVWGGDTYGQLGLGPKYIGKNHPIPRTCTFNLIIENVSCGEEHSAFITSKGNIYTMGSNNEGRLGIGNKKIKESSSPCLVETCINYRCIQISCGWGHTIAIMDNGEAFSWGVGEYGALGQGNLETQWKPSKVLLEGKASISFKKVSCGSRHTALISESNELYVCGAGDIGQLGTGRRDRELTPIKLSTISDKVNQVACGIFHTLILTTINKNMILAKGSVYSTGGNSFGQLGVGNQKNTNIPLKINEFDQQRIIKITCSNHSAALNDKGEIFIWGTGVFGEYLSPVKISQTSTYYKDIDIGGFFGGAIDDTGLVWTWGNNAKGELGIGDYESRITPFPNIYLQEKQVKQLSCGGSYIIALGEVIKPTKRKMLEDTFREQISEKEERSQIQKKSKTPPREYSRRDNAEINEKVSHHRASWIDHNDEINNSEKYKQSQMIKSGLKSQKKLKNTQYDHDNDYSTRKLSARNHEEILDNTFSISKRKDENIDSLSSRDKYMGRKEKSPYTVSKNNPNLSPPLNSTSRKLDNSYIQLLMKQKDMLENNLKEEREERLYLQNNVKELKKKLKELQEGPDGIFELQISLENQIKLFKELKQLYDNEVNKYEKICQEIDEYKRKNFDLKEKLNEKEFKIKTLEIRVSEYEMYKLQIDNEYNKISTNYFRQNENQEEINKLHQIIKEMTKEIENYRKFLNDSEMINKQKEIEIKSTMNKLIEELKDNLQQTNNKLEMEQNYRLKLENELMMNRRKSGKLLMVNNNENHYDDNDEGKREGEGNSNNQFKFENLRLRKDLEDTRAVIDKLTQEDKSDNSNSNMKNNLEINLIQENDTLKKNLEAKEMEINGLNQKIRILEENLASSENKNTKLIDMLDQVFRKNQEQAKTEHYHHSRNGTSYRLENSLLNTNIGSNNTIEKDIQMPKQQQQQYEYNNNSGGGYPSNLIYQHIINEQDSFNRMLLDKQISPIVSTNFFKDDDQTSLNTDKKTNRKEIHVYNDDDGKITPSNMKNLITPKTPSPITSPKKESTQNSNQLSSRHHLKSLMSGFIVHNSNSIPVNMQNEFLSKDSLESGYDDNMNNNKRLIESSHLRSYNGLDNINNDTLNENKQIIDIDNNMIGNKGFEPNTNPLMFKEYQDDTYESDDNKWGRNDGYQVINIHFLIYLCLYCVVE